MHIVARYYDPLRHIATDFVREGKKVFHMHGQLSVILDKREDGFFETSGVKPGTFLAIAITETGGGRSLVGQSRGIVVAGIYGDPLRPYRVPAHPNINHEQAIFYLSDLALTVRATGNGKAQIHDHELKTDEDRAWIETRLLWEGMVGRLPPHLDCYDKAIWAAWEKSMCYHCVRPHYVAGFPQFLCPNASIMRGILHEKAH